AARASGAMVAEWMAAGFVHGVLNTDNCTITGESFDYGPWRFLPRWDPSFTAAYFDEGGLYAFGRQPEAIRWNLAQLAISLRQMVAAEPLIAALNRFGPCYQEAMIRRFCWRLGIVSQGVEKDSAVIEAAEITMREEQIGPFAFFHRYRGGRNATGPLAKALAGYDSCGADDPHWNQPEATSLLIDEVEAIWSAIAEHDDWQPLYTRIAAIHALGQALGDAPTPSGHLLISTPASSVL
ncbi:MAG: protein adenylyltransferase SelO family protein, partial [Alteraurantiacibacter sp.]|nr:protein adenylyltransferase SelO family protein [Alteraurantiacibacter sp.]